MKAAALAPLARLLALVRRAEEAGLARLGAEIARRERDAERLRSEALALAADRSSEAPGAGPARPAAPPTAGALLLTHRRAEALVRGALAARAEAAALRADLPARRQALAHALGRERALTLLHAKLARAERRRAERRAEGVPRLGAGMLDTAQPGSSSSASPPGDTAPGSPGIT